MEGEKLTIDATIDCYRNFWLLSLPLSLSLKKIVCHALNEKLLPKLKHVMIAGWFEYMNKKKQYLVHFIYYVAAFNQLILENRLI
jgi:hypothetical protein